ncbi:MAG: metallophosphoesterase [Candidatus Micrarchaeota archaeon]
MKIKFQKSEIDKLFFTSDLHLNHGNIIRHCNRPFSGLWEMNDVLIANWNSVVPKDGVVIVAGDLIWNNPMRYLPQLNGRIILVFGNHDKASIIMARKTHRNFFHLTCDLLDISINDEVRNSITVCHYQMRAWNKSHYNAAQLFGHNHSKNPFCGVGKQLNIGVDGNNFFPYTYTQIVEMLGKCDDNPNLVKGRQNETSDVLSKLKH